METLAELISRNAQSGRVEWIGVRPKRRKPLLAVDEVHIQKQGLEGDHYSSGGKRSVTANANSKLTALSSKAPASVRLALEWKKYLEMADIPLSEDMAV